MLGDVRPEAKHLTDSAKIGREIEEASGQIRSVQ
jgi:hypothetical protein